MRIGFTFATAALAAWALYADARPARAQTHTNHLVGIGLVMGLSGTGDDLGEIPFTVEALRSALGRLGRPDANLSAYDRGVAMVMITTERSFGGGDPTDVRVVAMGNARSLVGGQLVLTSLQGPDGEIYALAEGPMASCAGSEPVTVACISGGAHSVR